MANKKKTKKIIGIILLSLLIAFLLLGALNHPTVLKFANKNPITRAITGVTGGIVDVIFGEVEGEPEVVEIIFGEELEDCIDDCDGDEGCIVVCEEEATLETCVLVEGTVIDDVGTFWNTCFPRWTGVHQWSCRFLRWGTWYETEDKLGCDGTLWFVGCDWRTYQYAGEVCEQIGGTWSCNPRWGGDYFCEL